MPAATNKGSLPKADRAYEYTATGVLGDKRKTMLSNELHLRSELGKTKGHGHTFNETTNKTAQAPYDGGVKAALVWVTPKTKLTKRSKKNQFKPKDTDEQIRQGTPIGAVLSFQYQNEWIAQQLETQKAKKKEADAKRVIPGAYRENYTSTLRAAMKQPSEEVVTNNSNLWKMSKFTDNAQPALDTFRSDSARQRSMKQLAEE